LNAPLPDPEPFRPIGDVAPPPVGRDAPFIADALHGPDLLDTSNAIRPIIELVAHRDGQTPMMIAIVGPSGAGKSFALDRIVAGVEALGAAAKGMNGPFVSEIVTVRVDAAAMAGDPITATQAKALITLRSPTRPLMPAPTRMSPPAKPSSGMMRRVDASKPSVSRATNLRRARRV
jgi:hypothetical protein